ncbi:glycoside hydrolase family 26 protein [Nocardioides antri]|uniref:Beta-mannanase n=1 Tax=Nocardioides antri TaxID=2607659 RepID=A0A5B1M7D4_9ACTN|nr:glycosyl hydrolase [Nocardioides antri]KAA1428791.1 beta-mannanase [Nocardioides antri]
MYANPRPTRRAVLVGALGLGASAVVPPRAAAASALSSAAATTGRVYGLAVEGWPGSTTYLNQLNRKVGRKPDQLTYYASWATVPDFPFAWPGSRAAATTPAVELVWEPWNPAHGTSQPAYSLAAIARGAHDAYLRRWAAQIKAYRLPVVIRFAHEMNGDWYPWAEAVNGNAPGDYAAAWRHVVEVFDAAGVPNVTWSWAPNVSYYGSWPLAGLYPGDGYVDRVGVDGYNWGTSRPQSQWRTVDEVFGPTVAELGSLAPTKPIHITETGCTELGGNKAAWITGMWTWLDAHPQVRGLTWFSFNKETDWRIDSSSASLVAFRNGLWPVGA